MLYPEATAIAHSTGMSSGESRLSPSAKSFTTPRLRKLRSCEQVAAVCYRIGRRGIEFLLVQTRNGRWTFPKGGVEPGLTHAQTAALEAFEEAGVHGRMEHASFVRYVRRKRRAAAEVVVHAHLCEVLRLGPPRESNRNPTWFSAEKAKRCLEEDRKTGSAIELTRVVDRALARIQRLTADSAGIDELQKVQFEAVHDPAGPGRLLEASFARFIRREQGEVEQSAAITLAVNTPPSKLLRLGPSRNSRLLPAGEKQPYTKEHRTSGDGGQTPTKE